MDGRAPLNASKLYLLANGLGGMAATLVGLGVAFVPSRQVSSVWLYELKLIVACTLVFGSAYLFYRRARSTAPVVESVDVSSAFSGSSEGAL